MTPSFKFLVSPFFAALFFLLISHTCSFPHGTQTAFQGLDLFWTDPTVFSQESVYWGLQGYIGSSTTSLCNSIPILGGLSVLSNNGYFQKTYYSLTTHDTVYFRIEFYIIDNWQASDTVTIDVDGTTFTIGDMTTLSKPTDLCGDSNYNDGQLTFVGRLDHTNGQAVLKIISNVNTAPSQAGFGVRNVVLMFGTKSGAQPAMACNIATNLNVDKSCGCPTGQYPDPLNSNQCTACHANCADCFGPSASECFACSTTTGSSFVNNECIKCATGCLDCIGPFANQCFKCASGYWSKWDTTCPTTCSSPVADQQVYTDVKLCKPPCPTNDYYLSNNTCSAVCPSILGQYTNYFSKFCQLPCSTSTDYYHLSNSSCDAYCSSPKISYYKDDVVLVCDMPCPTGEKVYPDGSCNANCDLPRQVVTVAGVDKCISPCTDPALPYYDLNNSVCVATCNTPNVQGQEDIYDTCHKPCATGEKLYPDGSCNANCDLPRQVVTVAGVDKCISPCTDPALPYYDLNNSVCVATCNTPNVQGQEDIYDTCNKPCSTGQYVYPDNLCYTGCDTPLVITTQAGVDKCGSPCSNPSLQYYSEQNQVCIASCSSSYIQHETWYDKCLQDPSAQTPTTTLTDSEVREVRVTSSIVDTGGDIMAVASTMAIAFGSTNPAVGTLGAFVKMLPYIRYINITYPVKLQAMLDNLNSTLISFSFSIPIPESLEADFNKKPLPHKFDNYSFHSSFFVNYWNTMTALAILLCFIIFLNILYFISKKNKDFKQLFEGLKLVFQWNFFLMIFCNNFDSIVLGTSLEFRTVQFDSSADIFSFFWCIFLNCMLIYILGLAFYIIKDIRKKKHQIFPEAKKITEKQPNPETRWKKFQLFFKGSKDTSLARHAFMLPFLIRIYLFNFIIAHIYTAPLVQASLIVSLSVSMLLLMLLLKPFVSAIVFCQHVTDEIIMLVVNCCMLTLAILDSIDSTNQELRDNLGGIIIYANVIFSFTANMYLGAYLFVGFQAAHKNMKANPRKGAVYWLIALLAPYENGGMDMDLGPEKEDLVKGDPDKEDIPLPTSSTRVVEMHRGTFLNDIEGRRTSITLHNRRDSSSLSVPGTKQDLSEAPLFVVKPRKPSLNIQIQNSHNSSNSHLNNSQNVSPTVSPNNASMMSQHEGSPLKMSYFARKTRASVHVEASTPTRDEVIINPVQGNSTELLFPKTKKSRKLALEHLLAIPESHNTSTRSDNKPSLVIE